MILSWLDKRVSTLELKITIEASHCSHPRENLTHDVILGYLAFDVAKGFVTEGLDFKLGSMRQHNIRDSKPNLTKLART